MKSHWHCFNIYLALALAVVAAAGCRTSGDPKPKKLLSTLRLHLEVSRDISDANQAVPIYREKPIMVKVEKAPFLTEAEVASARVVDALGGLELQVQFDRRGSLILEEYTTANRGRRVAVFSQFGEKIEAHRWLAAPFISRRITDGAFTFTPDASREEAEQIAAGLNNVARKVKTWVDR